ncbi:hypothetical protein ABXT66_07810 [Candidatus Levibacter sp. Uisw_134_01]|uniref:hypothetical protein n=1 Tax=Candidatus Levibacter sp. Uisw_134_01 TaxID=3230999 RepID=UPI003D475246
MLKKIERFKRLATLRKRDISKEIANSNLIENEIIKNQNLITQIDTIMDNGRAEKSDKIISSGYFKNNAQLLNTLQNQKNIADNRNKHLLNEKKNIQQKIIINNLKKNKAEDKTSEYKKKYRNELEKRNSL